jgi:hypothetical protein
MMTCHEVHSGLAQQQKARRNVICNEAFLRHAERFVKRTCIDNLHLWHVWLYTPIVAAVEKRGIVANIQAVASMQRLCQAPRQP